MCETTRSNYHILLLAAALGYDVQMIYYSMLCQLPKSIVQTEKALQHQDNCIIKTNSD